MLKKIKRVKEMRLDELIKYVWDNEMEGIVVKSKAGDKYKAVHFKHGSTVLFVGSITEEDIFEITVEETITEDTEFDGLVEVFDETSITYHHYSSIRDVKDSRSEKIYALIDGELQLVWQRDDVDEVEC